MQSSNQKLLTQGYDPVDNQEFVFSNTTKNTNSTGFINK